MTEDVEAPEVKVARTIAELRRKKKIPPDQDIDPRMVEILLRCARGQIEIDYAMSYAVLYGNEALYEKYGITK